MKQYRWGIIGLGAIAHEFAQSMREMGRAPYAVAAGEYARAQAFGQQYGATKVYGSYEELARDKSVDIVYVATVNSQHYDNISLCLAHDKHVLCEKAIWGNHCQLTGLCEKARGSGLILAEAMTIFHMPLMKKVREMIAHGELGAIKFVEAELGSLKEDDPNNRFFSKQLGGGAMLDIGTYGLSFVSYFMPGQITEVKSTMSPYPTGVDESWSIAMKSSMGQVASVNLTFRAKMPKRGIIAGDKAYVVINNYVRADKADLVLPDGTCTELRAGETAKALEYEILDMEQAVATGDASFIYLDQTVQVVSLMDRLLNHP